MTVCDFADSDGGFIAVVPDGDITDFGCAAGNTPTAFDES
jgi:hypothetical protein